MAQLSGALGPFGFQIRPADTDYAAWAGNYPEADFGDPGADFDGDGVSNDDERLFGLDPSDPTSVNPITVPLDGDAGTFSFTRRDDALTGKFTAIDLVTWTEDTGALLVEGSPDGAGVELMGVTLSPELLNGSKLFARVRQDDGILFSTGFEIDGTGFTVSTTSGTDWQWGPPDTDGAGGTLMKANGESTNCWATDLGAAGDGDNVGYYDNSTASGTSTVLRSPVIDLTGVTAARLSFAEALDLDGEDTAEVHVIDNTTGLEIGPAIYTASDEDISNTGLNWAPVGPISLPPGAADREIYLEWRFTGQATEYAGWYIDDVSVSRAPAP